MEYRLGRTAQGWTVEDQSGRVAAGPFSRDAAVAWIEARGHAEDQEQRDTDARVRAEHFSDSALISALSRAIQDPPPPPRGRPVPDHYQAKCIAIEYYWQCAADKKRGRINEAQVVAQVAKEFGCSKDFVRKCRKDYAPVASYDEDLDLPRFGGRD